MRRHRNLLVAAPVAVAAVAAVVAFSACTPAEADGHPDGGPEDRSSSTAPAPEPAEADVETDVAAPHDHEEAGATTPPHDDHHAHDRVSTDARSGTQDGCQAHQLDVNDASLGDLERIVHIGSARAGQLTELRPFSDVGDLTRIPGIGERRLLDIVEQDLACTG